ncbi:putative oxidoreductase [Lophiotrema nucula]|uniref:Putative oxidoreductase n=1 Tax=Lophiotrema nucula TaxID=690887 RepID=A0A6A5Z5I5_9PLEO|nr:putative oxidoreductase [Lophiotrema nucula]
MPHSDHSPSPARDTFASFPPTVPTAPLLRVSLQKLLDRDPEELDRCWKACCELGFFYLDLQNTSSQAIDGKALLQDADQLFEVMKGFFDLSVEEKTQYDFADKGSYFGYKGYGKGIVDAKGTKDRNEFYNISKDDILGLSEQLPSPDVLNAQRDLYESYIKSSHAVCMLITSLVSSRLPLTSSAKDNGGLEAVHKLGSVSGDQIRFVKAPPQEPNLKGVALGEHTDFGSVTVLFNRLGGLQVRLPDYIDAIPPATHGISSIEQQLCNDGWAYVRPLPGHCIVNLGDALVKFSDGKLRSNIHRVVAPPGEQAKLTRYSLVYFCRPEDDVVLQSMVEGGQEDEEKVTAKEWILRRALGRRKADGWEKSNGTEATSMRSSVKA